MKILIPPQFSSQPARPVSDYGQIRDIAKAMLELLNADAFTVGLYKDGFALHHAQVSADPFDFFVVHDRMREAFGASVVCNPQIDSAALPVPFKEACLSYPFRAPVKTKRYNLVRATVDIPHPLLSMFGKLKEVVLELEDLPAIIMQHEVEHGDGKSLFKR